MVCFMKNILLLLSALLLPLIGIGQTIFADEEINDSLVVKWTPKLTVEYGGLYLFGISEAESELIIIYTPTEIVAQIKSGEWSTDGKSWNINYETLTNVKIANGHFQSDQYEGEFVRLNLDGSLKNGLKIKNPWTAWVKDGYNEVGIRRSQSDYFKGKYPQASKKLLSEEELTDLSPSELSIMRNEIFARYGYKFKNGGQMQSYFKRQPWYQEQRTNVNSYLTAIEKYNISVIRKIENQK